MVKLLCIEKEQQEAVMEKSVDPMNGCGASDLHAQKHYL